jgi:hypothetical protein
MIQIAIELPIIAIRIGYDFILRIAALPVTRLPIPITTKRISPGIK